MSTKTAYIKEMLTRAVRLSEISDVMPERVKEYSDSAYGSLGADEIVDADFTALGYDMSAAEFTDLITLFTQFNNFTGNQPVVQGDYMATLNKIRRVANL